MDRTTLAEIVPIRAVRTVFQSCTESGSQINLSGCGGVDLVGCQTTLLE
jgi:hypothetical protein